MTSVCLGVATLLFGVSTRVEEKPQLPRGVAPRFVVASLDAAGNLLLKELVIKYVPVQRVVEVNQGGVIQRRVETVTVPRYEQTLRQVAPRDYQVYGTDGKKIDPKTLARRLKTETVIVLSGDGRPVDPAYLKFFKDGTPVFVVTPGGRPEVVPQPRPRDRVEDKKKE